MEKTMSAAASAAAVASSSPSRKKYDESPKQARLAPFRSDDDVIDLGPPALGDPDDEEIADLESNIMQRSRTMEDFARIISEWRTDRERAAAATTTNGRPLSVYGAGAQAGEGSSSQGHLRIRRSIASLSAEAARSDTLDVYDDGASQYSYEASSVGDPDEANGGGERVSPSLSPIGLGDAASSSSVRVRCTCCCGRGTRRCKRARKATREWSQVESDLRLAAQIGQALLRRSDALQSELASKQDEHGSRINSLMKKLSMSIKETTQLAKRLEQSELNMEACEASNRALVRELDEARQDLAKAKGSSVRSSGIEARLKRAEQEADDLRQEADAERRQCEQWKSKLKRLEKINEDLLSEVRLAKVMSKKSVEVTDTERMKRKEEVRKMVEERLGKNGSEKRSDGDADDGWIESLVTENDSLAQENRQMRDLLESRNEELAQLREELSQRHGFAMSAPPSATPASEDNAHTRPLRLSDLQSTSGLVALGDEIVDPESVTYVQSSPIYLSPQTANVSLPSASTASIASSVGTVTESEATSTHPEGVAVRHSTGGAKPSLNSAPSAASGVSSATTKRETRTAQLNLLLDTIQRLFSRLSTADVDTLAKRLQRQKLAGDVGHLARTTVNGILRDVDGLRDHFRRAMDNEAKGRGEAASDNVSVHSRTSGKSGGGGSQPAESDSLVARKEFFALIKVFKDLFIEMARLRNAVNEVSMQPQYAARILQEQLGVQMSEEKGVGAWFGRLLSSTTSAVGSGTGPSSAGATTSNPSATTAGGSSASSGLPNSTTATSSGMSSLGVGSGSGIRSTSARTSSGSQLNATRASAAVVPSAVAVEVKGMHASEQQLPGSGGDGVGGGGGSSRGTSPQPDVGPSSFEPAPSHARPAQARRPPNLSRTQSRNLSGLFVGSMSGGGGGGGMNEISFPRSRMASEQSVHQGNGRLSRIVDDDEVSIHQGFASRARTLRPRNLSDSSMHTTFLDDEVSTEEQQQSGAGLDGRRALGRRTDGRGTGLMSAASPMPAALSRVITPSTLSLQASADDGRTTSSTSSASTGGLFGKAFGLLSATTGTTAATASASAVPSHTTTTGAAPALRTKTSRAQLALAAATATAAPTGEAQVDRRS